MAQFTTTSLKCRSTRCVKLYASVYDPIPSNMLLIEDTDFISRKQYKSGTIEMAYISECEEGPIGYWCPMNVLRVVPFIEAEDTHDIAADGSVSAEVELYINATGTAVYMTATGAEKSPNGLAIGDHVYCDRKVEVVNNGITETRYRIRLVRGDDQTLKGSWIVANRAIVSSDGPKIVMHNPMVRTVSADAGISLLAADDNTPDSGKGGAAVIDGSTNGVSYGTNAKPGTYNGQNVGNGSGNLHVKTPTGETLTVPETPSSSTDVPTVKEEETYNTVDLNDIESVKELYEAYGFSYTATADQSLMGIPIGRMTFVHGMPFQYTHITDRRGNSVAAWGQSEHEHEQSGVTSGAVDLYGRAFAANIAANMPIAVIAPGKPKFLTSVKDGLFGYASGSGAADARNNWAGYGLTSLGEAGENALLSQLADTEGDYQYYSIQIDTESYYKYVNSLCQTSARLMDLADETYRGIPCASLDWGKLNSAAEQDFSVGEEVLGLAGGVSFAFEPQSNVSDTINNTTQESQFSSMFNTISGKAREMEFILGYSGSDIPGFIDSTNYVNPSVANMSTTGGVLPSIGNVFRRVGSWLDNSAHGMNVRFPEIWSDSQYSKSYDLDMHFIAPYATHFCKWRYVLVPFFHIFALAAPKSDKNISQYSSPFLIRAYSKGFFNVEMGIIETLTWKRFGDKDMISEDGIPTQIDVSISFKDLYHALAMTAIGEKFIESSDFFNNSGLMDLIGTLSGVNMNRVTLQERIALFVGSSWTAFGALGSNYMRHISDRVRNVADRFLFGV